MRSLGPRIVYHCADIMHVGLLIYGSLATISGGFLYDRQLVSQLEASGHTVEIVSVPWRNYARHLTDNWSAALADQLRRAPFDLLLQDELTHPSLAWLNRRLRGRINYPIITIVHHLRSSETHSPLLIPLYRSVERQYLRTVDGFLFNSKTTRATVMELWPNTKPQVVAYPAADHRRPPATDTVGNSIQGRAARQGPLRILFIGNVIARKGLHHLLRALALLQGKHWVLRVIGSLSTDARYVEQIGQLIEKLDLTANVRLEGTATEDAIAAAYRESDLFAAPAYEGFGIVYLEAMSFGLPVIASTDGAAYELVADGVNGYLVDPDDHATLARRIERLVEDRAMLVPLSEGARQRYESHPTWHESFAPAIDWLVTQSEQ